MEASNTASLQADADHLDDPQKKERHLRPLGQQPALLTPVPSRLSQDRLSLHHTRSHTSHVDGHGYFNEDQDGEQQVAIESSAEKAFEIGWDGPDDPMNPKNMGTFRKWMIVMINAFGALCVTCTSSLYTITYGQCVQPQTFARYRDADNHHRPDECRVWQFPSRRYVGTHAVCLWAGSFAHDSGSIVRVLWPSTHLYICLCLLHHLANSVRPRKEHPNHAGFPFSGRLLGECLSVRCGRHGRRHVQPRATSGPNDDLYCKPDDRPWLRAYNWWLYQLQYLLAMVLLCPPDLGGRDARHHHDLRAGDLHAGLAAEESTNEAKRDG